ncbi:MAG: YeeE/YedE thiosulfate transporter family protein [Novosphingobium sp.]|nr:YeeE/YedE thiosulfate transporter family protein [Novosphingobium sp.]
MLHDQAGSLAAAGLALAILFAGLTGLAIQRGSICMVAAVEEFVTKRRLSRLFGLTEAAVWVTGVLAIAMLFGMQLDVEPDFGFSAGILAGGVFLGAGALLNNGCLFGTIAKLGSGNWHYLFTPAGFFLGCMVSPTIAPPPVERAPMQMELISGGVALGVLALFLIIRLIGTWRHRRRGRPEAEGWQESYAALVIGLASGLLLLLAGAWAYSDALTRLASGGGLVRQDVALFAALLVGALAGGGALRPRVRWQARVALGCLVGGALMGFGAAMVPGGNDKLILFGLPLLRPYAWIGIAAMTAAIWVGLLLRAKFSNDSGR